MQRQVEQLVQERDQLSASLTTARAAEHRLTRDLAVQTAAQDAEQATVATLRLQLSEVTTTATTVTAQHQGATGTVASGF
jgi:hypothetical protein